MKYLFFDIDGTLVGESKKVTKKTREAIQLAKANGHHVFLCTGRAPTSINEDVKSVGFEGIISSAGGFVQVGDTYIYENFINQYILAEVMLLFTNKKILFSLESKDALYQTPGVLEFFQKQMHERIPEGNLELARFLEERRKEEIRLPISKFDILTTPITKLCFISPDKFAFLDCVKYLSEFFHIVTFSKPEDSFINGEIILKNCTKGDGMERIIHHIGGTMEDTIAYGDSLNDYQMIETANIGVVSVLSPDKLKSIANDFFEDPDNDGIAKHLEKIGII
ncbi:Cof-type HAD-IIB family hydrolase [Tannockella kyphosi]|uniref:Cof-type HAD-IIB family hydrolase n=1 Tax=Tannockella kyphosi TaxID=2899121 RepID=UPI0020119634|nr:HAD family hydrolase [Tannockella kyphosi]